MSCHNYFIGRDYMAYFGGELCECCDSHVITNSYMKVTGTSVVGLAVISSL